MMCYAGLDPAPLIPNPMAVRSIFDEITDPIVALMTIAKADKRFILVFLYFILFFLYY